MKYDLNIKFAFLLNKDWWHTLLQFGVHSPALLDTIVQYRYLSQTTEPDNYTLIILQKAGNESPYPQTHTAQMCVSVVVCNYCLVAHGLFPNVKDSI
jgi:hypothetical protein